jgi:hypothetical protein
MNPAPTREEAQQSLNDHAAIKGAEIHEKYGPRIGWNELLLILADRACVRYPCEIAFDSAPLEEGEFAHPVPKGDKPEDGFTIHVHPYYAVDLSRLPFLVLYQLVLVNYGGFSSPDDAEIFGANAMGLPKDEYYRAVCEMADELAGDEERGCGVPS